MLIGLNGLILACALIGGASAQPLAVSGVLDLSALDLAESGSLRLDGDWEFYPGQLLSPPDFAQAERAAVDHLALPGSWGGFLKDGRKLDASGVATFRLRIVPPRHQGNLALRVFDVRSAYRLWVNGELVSAKGAVGERAQTERADPSLDLPMLRDNGGPLELVVEVSNFHYRDGGLSASILLGTEAGIRGGQSQRWALAFFFAGGLLVMGCYHLFYWSFRRSDAAPLYFGLYCLLWMGNYVASNSSDWAALLFFPEASVDFLERVNAVCLFISIPVGYSFFSALFPGQFSPGLLKTSWVVFGAFTLLPLAAPMITLQTLVPYSYLAAVLLIGYCLFQLARARRRQRSGAGFMLAGFAILGLIAVNDMLNDVQLIRTLYLLPVGMFAFILSQGFAFSLNLSRAFSAIESLSSDLEERNLALEVEEVERGRLEREIVNASESERRCLSLDLHDGLCQELAAARLHCSVLEQKQGASGQHDAEFSVLSSLLDHSVNHAYELSRGLWPLDHDSAGMNLFLEDFCRRLAVAKGIVILLSNFRACAIYPKDDAIHLYRIAQEAINNAVKHAKASLIEVSLDCAAPQGRLTLRVRDNGVGIGGRVQQTSPGGLGMRIMAHRARMIGGGLTIDDVEGGGTEVVCTIACGRCARIGDAG